MYKMYNILLFVRLFKNFCVANYFVINLVLCRFIVMFVKKITVVYHVNMFNVRCYITYVLGRSFANLFVVNCLHLA